MNKSHHVNHAVGFHPPPSCFSIYNIYLTISQGWGNIVGSHISKPFCIFNVFNHLLTNNLGFNFTDTAELRITRMLSLPSRSPLKSLCPLTGVVVREMGRGLRHRNTGEKSTWTQRQRLELACCKPSKPRATRSWTREARIPPGPWGKVVLPAPWFWTSSL